MSTTDTIPKCQRNMGIFLILQKNLNDFDKAARPASMIIAVVVISLVHLVHLLLQA